MYHIEDPRAIPASVCRRKAGSNAYSGSGAFSIVGVARFELSAERVRLSSALASGGSLGGMLAVGGEDARSNRSQSIPGATAKGSMNALAHGVWRVTKKNLPTR